MNFWILLAFVSITWLVWLIGCVMALKADQLRRKRPPDAGVSIVPVIPLFPLLAVEIATLIDKLVPPWGTRIIAGLHSLLLIVYLVGIAYEARRIRSLRGGIVSEPEIKR
jgi:hypothetical protein